MLRQHHLSKERAAGVFSESALLASMPPNLASKTVRVGKTRM